MRKVRSEPISVLSFQWSAQPGHIGFCRVQDECPGGASIEPAWWVIFIQPVFRPGKNDPDQSARIVLHSSIHSIIFLSGALKSCNYKFKQLIIWESVKNVITNTDFEVYLFGFLYTFPNGSFTPGGIQSMLTWAAPQKHKANLIPDLQG